MYMSHVVCPIRFHKKNIDMQMEIKKCGDLKKIFWNSLRFGEFV